MKKVEFLYSLFTICSLLLTSCLKHDAYIMNLNSGTPNNAIYFAKTGDDVSTAGTAFARYNIDMGFYTAGLRDTFNVNVTYGGADVAPQDINVTFSVVDSILDQFNDENGTEYEVPPASVFSIPNTVVTIKKGERSATVKVALVVNNDYDYTVNYAIPLKIISSSYGNISSNMGTAIYSFGGRNDYDGVYSVEEGNVTRYTSPGVPANDALSGSMVGNPDMSLVTTGLYTVELQNLKWHGGTSGVAGIDNLRATINPTTNNVTMVSLGGPTLTNIAGAVNKYDPDTKTYTLNFIWNPTGAARTIENLVLKYKGPR